MLFDESLEWNLIYLTQRPPILFKCNSVNKFKEKLKKYRNTIETIILLYVIAILKRLKLLQFKNEEGECGPFHRFARQLPQ